MAQNHIRGSYLRTSKRYYDERFGEKGDTKRTEEERRRLAAIGATLESELGRLGEGARPRILDFGCGRGWLSNALSRYGDVTGIDLSDEAVRRAAREHPHVKFQAGDVTDAKIPELLGEQSFDVVVSSEVVEHVLDQDGFFRNVDRLLKPQNSLFVMTTPNGRWKQNWFYGERKSWGQPYEFWLTRDEIAARVRGDYRELRLGTFFSDWIKPCKSYGMLNLLGHRAVDKAVRVIGQQQRYYELLDRRGVGLYILLFAAR
ncbi:MAG: methyltransferase domain-containing protein [bacterium]|nr:methyltransferase domain-containing protein [bacterium]